MGAERSDERHGWMEGPFGNGIAPLTSRFDTRHARRNTLECVPDEEGGRNCEIDPFKQMSVNYPIGRATWHGMGKYQ